MNDIRKALLISFTIQGCIIIFLILNIILASLSFEIIRIRIWYLPIVYFLNIFFCLKTFYKPFEDCLKKISPDDYKNLFGDPLANNSFKIAAYAFQTNCNDSNCVKKMKQYLKISYLLFVIILLLMLPISLIIVAF